MSSQDNISGSPRAAEALSPGSPRPASTPMTMSYVLNPLVPESASDPQGVVSLPLRSPAGAMVPAADAHTNLGEAAAAAAAEDAQARDVSPAPSTGEPPAKGATAADATKAADQDTQMKGCDSPKSPETVDEDEEMQDAVTDETKAFTCMYDEHETCKTGQEHNIKLCRKTISDHFGRNKGCTLVLKKWPLFCRKHYQRATYKLDLWQTRKISLILKQFNAIEEDFPGTQYKVILKKSEEDRFNLFSRMMISGMYNAEAEARAAVTPKDNKQFEAPIDVLRELFTNSHLGDNKTKEQVEETVDILHQMLENGDTKQIPSIEFLPQLDRDGNKCAASEIGKSPKKNKTSSNARVSKSGAVIKPSSSRASRKKRTTKASSA